jgi:BirA family transcriptional regulator, biotin operon repressor / biotin---[acetyl-CoA-carboxylase] ligase
MTKNLNIPAIIHLGQTDSTNRYASELLKKGPVDEFTTISTFVQTAGKGQKGSSWESEPFKNLTFTIITKPSFLPFSRHFYLSVVASLAITDFMGRYLPEVQIKWPNDIYCQGKKIAGILIENTLGPDAFRDSLTGIGLNLNQELFVSDAPNPSSMKLLAGREFIPAESLDCILERYVIRYKELLWRQYPDLMDTYYSRLLGYLKYREYSSSGQRFTAKIVGVLDTGELQLLKKDGSLQGFNFKEVEFLF